MARPGRYDGTVFSQDKDLWRERSLDLGLCVLVLAALVAVLITTKSTSDWITPFLQAVAAFGLLFRRSKPTTVVILMVIGALPLLAEGIWPGLLPNVDQEGVWVPLATPIACYSLIVYGTDLVVAALFIGALTIIATRPWVPSIAVIAPGLLLTAMPALAGMYVRAQHRLTQALSDRAERAEREQHLLAEQARADERARLALEMHDVVTHRISLMVLQAGALRVTSAEESTRTAADELREAGCQALEELRDFLGVLRSAPSQADETGPDSGSEPLTPDLTRLVAESRAVGVQIDLVEDGPPPLASPLVRRTAYRIVQEALTNVLKHAAGAPVCVQVSYDGAWIRLSVRNEPPEYRPNPELSSRGSGAGLAGLRRRVDLVGGQLTAGPRPDGGFEVAAELPAFVPADG